jgi:hypothetical protein
MIRPKGKAQKIAQAVMKKQGVKLPKPTRVQKDKPTGPYLLH